MFQSADPDYLTSHVDVTRIKEYWAEAIEADRRRFDCPPVSDLSASRLINIVQIQGRVRATDSEFVLACDMWLAARESALFCQPEPALGVLPGGGAAQHLARLMGSLLHWSKIAR